MKTPFEKAIKEAGRVVLLSVIPVVITSIEKGHIDWKLIGAVALIAFLRYVDKWLHEYGKGTKNESMIQGLTRF